MSRKPQASQEFTYSPAGVHTAPNYGSSHKMTAKRPPNQPGNETVLSLKYIPRQGSLNTKPVVGDSRRNDHDAPEDPQQTRHYHNSRSNPRIPDKRAAVDLLQSKLSNHSRAEMIKSKSSSSFYRSPPYPGPRPDRPTDHNPEERGIPNYYKASEMAKKPSGMEMWRPRLEIIHSRSKSEPWDPVHLDENPNDGMRRTYKETTLGPHITTVETFRENYDNVMSNTVDQIEKAFGGSPATSKKLPSLAREKKNRRLPPNARPQEHDDYISSTSNESLPTSDTYSDSDRERNSTARKKPLSSKRLVSKKIGVRAEITSTTAKSPGPSDTPNRDVLSPSIQSSTTVFVRSKSNDAQNENTSSLKRTPKTTEPALRTVNREEVIVSRENSGSLTSRKRQGIIRDLPQSDLAYVYSPRPFHAPSVAQKGSHEPDAFQFPEADTRGTRDDKPKIVSQTKICLMSPTSKATQLNSVEDSEDSPAMAPRSTPSAIQEKGNRTHKVPYFVKNKREHVGITPELVDERINKIMAGKQRSKSSPDTGRRGSVNKEVERKPSFLPRSEGLQSRLSERRPSLAKEGQHDSVLDAATQLLNATEDMTRDASSTIEMLTSWGNVGSPSNNRSEQRNSKMQQLGLATPERERVKSGE